MRKTVTIVFLILSFIGVFAQKGTKKVSISWSDPSKKTLTNFGSVLSSDENGFYALNHELQENGQSRIIQFNKDMEIVNQTILKLENRILDFVILNSGNFWVFCSKIDDEKITKTLYKQRYHGKSLELLEEEIMFSINCPDIFQAYQNFTYKKSKNGNLIGIFHKSSEMGKQKLWTFMLDDSFKFLWSKKLNLRSYSGFYDLRDLLITDNGFLYLLGTIKQKRNKYKIKGKPAFYHEVLQCNEKGVIGSSVIKHPTKFINSPKLYVSNDGKLRLIALYSDKNFQWAKGVYNTTINPLKRNSEIERFSDFDHLTVVEGFGKLKTRRFHKRKNRGDLLELKKYKVNDVLPRENGGVILVAEQRFITEGVKFMLGGGTRRTNVLHYNDILVANLDSEGNIEWTKKITKKQISTDDFGRYSSYILTITNDKMYFIYNDNPKNVFAGRKEKTFVFAGNKHSLVTLAEINNQGDLSKESLFNII